MRLKLKIIWKSNTNGFNKPLSLIELTYNIIHCCDCCN